MRIERLAPGLHRTAPTHCPKCGLSITATSGMKRGTLHKLVIDAVKIMVCARCEVAIAQWDDKTLVLDAAQEAGLPDIARDALRETRDELRIAKASGTLRVPPEGP